MKKSTREDPAVAMVASGMSPKAAAEHFGISQDAVRSRCRRAGVAFYPEWHYRALKAVEAMKKDASLTVGIASKQFKVSKPIVKRYCVESGVKPQTHPRHPERDKAEALVSAGATHGEAVRQCREVSESAVQQWCHRDGVSSKIRNALREPMAIALARDLRCTFSDAARVVGATQKTVSKWCRRAGVISSYAQDPRKPRAVILVDKHDHSYGEAADAVGATRQAVGRWCREAGVSSLGARRKAGIADVQWTKPQVLEAILVHADHLDALLAQLYACRAKFNSDPLDESALRALCAVADSCEEVDNSINMLLRAA